MTEVESLAGFLVSLEDLRNGVDYKLRSSGESDGSVIGRRKSPITTAWNRVMSHRYGQSAHNDICECGLEPLAQEQGTAKSVDLRNLEEALVYLEDKRVITAAHKDVLEGAVAALFEVLPSIKAEFDTAEAQALDVAE